jgi:hypothetical protein
VLVRVQAGGQRGGTFPLRGGGWGAGGTPYRYIHVWAPRVLRYPTGPAPTPRAGPDGHPTRAVRSGVPGPTTAPGRAPQTPTRQPRPRNASVQRVLNAVCPSRTVSTEPPDGRHEHKHTTQIGSNPAKPPGWTRGGVVLRPDPRPPRNGGPCVSVQVTGEKAARTTTPP